MLPPCSFPPDAKVCTLIDPESTIWKVDQIQQLFTPLDAKLILSIPLSARLPSDRLICQRVSLQSEVHIKCWPIQIWSIMLVALT